MTPNIGTLLRAGIMAGAFSGGGFALAHFGKTWNQVEARVTTDRYVEVSYMGLGPVFANVRPANFGHFFSMQESELDWLHGQLGTQTTLVRGIRRSREETTCRSVLGQVNSLLRSEDEPDGIKIFRLDMTGKLIRTALDEEWQRRPESRRFDRGFGAAVQGLHRRAIAKIDANRTWGDYDFRLPAGLALLGALLFFIENKSERGERDDGEDGLEFARRAFEKIIRILPSGDGDSPRSPYVSASLGALGMGIAFVAGVLAVSSADAKRRSHDPIPMYACNPQESARQTPHRTPHTPTRRRLPGAGR